MGDWYQRWAGLKDIFSEYIQQNHQMLVIGAGNSRLSEEMYEEGYHNISNIDISLTVTKAMQEKYQDKAGMSYQQMDCRAMDFPEGIFNVVIDKATLDSILCVSHGQPSYRLTYLQRPEFGWSVKVHTVQKPMMGMTVSLASDDKDNVHYIYVCMKGEKTDAVGAD